MFMKKERNTFMTKLWDSLKNKVKTIQELSKEFPEKTYRQLEKYRDADRQEEAQRIFTQQENEELKENQHKESWEEKYNKEQKRSDYLQDELDRVKRENNDLHNKVAALLDSDAALRKVRESGL